MLDAVIKKRIIELTLAVYRVVDKFPEKEILRDKIKERTVDLAAKITACFYSHGQHEEISYRNLVVDFEVLRAYFGIARAWNLIDSGNFDILEEEYQKLIGSFDGVLPRNQVTEFHEDSGKIARLKRTVSNEENPSSLLLRNREKAILDCFKVNGVMRVGDLANIFSGVNKRTLRRDIEKLCKIGALARIGRHADTAYKLSNIVSETVSLGQS